MRNEQEIFENKNFIEEVEKIAKPKFEKWRKNNRYLHIKKYDIFLDFNSKLICPYLDNTEYFVISDGKLEDIQDELNKKFNKDAKTVFGNAFRWELMDVDELNQTLKGNNDFIWCRNNGGNGSRIKFKDETGGLILGLVLRYNAVDTINLDDCTSYLLPSSTFDSDDFIFMFRSSLPSYIGFPLPVCRILKKKSEDQIFDILLEHDLLPFDTQSIKQKVQAKMVQEALNAKRANELKSLLEEDLIRADIEAYPKTLLIDINAGHWTLSENTAEVAEIKKNHPHLVAKNPNESIVDGLVAIDFGTKNTVVVFQKDQEHILPMKVGTGNRSVKVQAHHYENPTIMEFRDLDSFLSAYNAKEGRPLTKWNDLVVSHTAFENLQNSASKEYRSFLNELKQWASTPLKRIVITDQKGKLIEIPPYKEMTDKDLDPIELYAYYLGLYINNMHNGIYLSYTLSFPITYEMEVRNLVIESFKRGILKSLPIGVLNNADSMQKFSVTMGATEPAAYAVTALESYGFDPIDDEQVFYGVFDFGGGTTDFDFGVFRSANPGLREERRYDYVLEHFGSGGDRYLGGENILELIAYDVFKQNADLLRQENITFRLHPEEREFLGSEALLSTSREANLNTKNLMEKLRPIWEKHADYQTMFESGSIKVNLWDKTETQQMNFELIFDLNRIEEIIRSRIQKGIINFFESLRLSFSNHKISKIDKVNIFLAGNSSKSPLVMDLFNEEIEKEIAAQSDTFLTKEAFEIFPSLGTEQAFNKMKELQIPFNQNDLEAPTGKTGVAFGLIKSRAGGKILVIDENVQKDIYFKFYLGENRRNRFRTVIDRTVPYQQWIEFIDASQSKFEIYYTDQPSASSNQLPINDVSIRIKREQISEINPDANIYIRLVSPTKIEYVVALPEEIANERYLSAIQTIELV